MPELPDIAVYVEALEKRVLGRELKRVRISNPFLLRTVVPPIQGLCGRRLIALRRLGKRIVFGFEDDFWLVLHLMIAGRLHWLPSSSSTGKVGPVKPGHSMPESAAKIRRTPAKNSLAVFEFETGILTLTEAGTKRRASLHLLKGEPSLHALNRGGLEVLDSSLKEFAEVITSQNHTLKRALTDPHLFSGIGNAYSDEILHRARLSPVALTGKLTSEQIDRLHRATRKTLVEWAERLRSEAGDAFPENVTAFRPEMAVHGKFGQPCPVCGSKVQRIRYADNETNYCPSCQTNGKLLADRSLSLLLKRDWPKTPEELEEIRSAARVCGLE